MPESDSKSVFLHQYIRRALQSGRYAPGERIDPATLAKEFRISTTPVRLALYRLVGEGLLADHARGGLRVPLLSEVAMRDLYDWMQRQLLIACDIGVAPASWRSRRPPATSVNGDEVKMTWQLFDSIAHATGQRALHDSVKRTNDRLAPIRRAKHGMLEHTADELAMLRQRWQQRDIAALKRGLREYHERRKELVPCIVAALVENSARFH